MQVTEQKKANALELPPCTSFCQNSDNSNGICRACLDREKTPFGVLYNIAKRMTADSCIKYPQWLFTLIEETLKEQPTPPSDYDAELHKIVMRHCSEKLSMDECRNMEIDILNSQPNPLDAGVREALDALKRDTEMGCTFDDALSNNIARHGNWQYNEAIEDAKAALTSCLCAAKDERIVELQATPKAEQGDGQ